MFVFCDLVILQLLQKPVELSLDLTQTSFQVNLFNHLDVRGRAQDARFVRV